MRGAPKEDKGALEVMRKKSNDTNSENGSLITAVKSIFAAVLLSVAALLLMGLMQGAAVKSAMIVPWLSKIIAYAVWAVGSFICGWLAARGTGKKGLITGFAAGLFLYLTMYFLGGIISGALAPMAKTLLNLLIAMLFAGTGGAVAVNLRK